MSSRFGSKLPHFIADVRTHSELIITTQAHEFYDACLPPPPGSTSFETCARNVMVAEGRGDEPAVTLGPSSSINAALGMFILQVAICIGYGWAYMRDSLDQNEKYTPTKNRVRYICTWFPSFSVILVQVSDNSPPPRSLRFLVQIEDTVGCSTTLLRRGPKHPISVLSRSRSANSIIK